MSVILITGASSGIGAALARHYATQGTRLVLTGRDRERLEAVAQNCRERGAEVRTRSIDVRAREAIGAWIREIDGQTPLDLVIVNAAVNGGHPSGGLETEATAFETADINLTGALNVMLPCVTLMSSRGRGQIALISSLAAYAPLPDAPAYSGAKAALLAHGLALRQKLKPIGVRLSVVTPGYVKTPMGGVIKGWRPLEISAEEAAARIARGLERDRDVIAFPAILAAIARGALLVPEWIRSAGLHGFRFRNRPRR
ncbi:MAG TPA: SDR family NAD(P)-dependent oxidoreductase [Methylorubrum populi]|uniref:SDR family NAD(P)-dependent oxidoreductase n=1 Tax=Methylorubrum populi TaxID=223967 RepID=A0A921E1B0_9HYPH|nr:SDR family NAD(P)-dependent oxidoreductase [Methylorubrum populi]